MLNLKTLAGSIAQLVWLKEQKYLFWIFTNAYFQFATIEFR